MKHNTTQPTADHTYEDYKRLVCKLAFRYWRSLPFAHRAHTDVEDFIQSGALVYTKLRERHDVSRGNFCTLLHISLQNHYTDLLNYYTRRTRTPVDCSFVEISEAISLADTGPAESCTDTSSGDTSRFSREVAVASSERAVTKLLERASPTARAYLAANFFDVDPSTKKRTFDETIVAELRELCRSLCVTPTDFRNVAGATCNLSYLR